MIKVLVTASLVIVALIFIVLAVLLGGAWWLSLKQPPAFALITEKYYVCPQHRALHGGIFGKGPTKIFFPDQARQWCWRSEWQEIGKSEFRSLATQWYNVDWKNEGDWWQYDASQID